MRPDSNDLSQGWLAIPFNGGVNLNTTNEEPSPPAYSYTGAANHFATPKYDAGTSPVASAAASRRSGGSSSSSSLSGYALPSSLPSYIEIRNLSGQAGGSSTPPASEASAIARGVLPAPVTQPKRYHGSLYRFSKMVLKIVGQGILIVGLCAAAVGVLWCIWRLVFWIAYRR